MLSLGFQQPDTFATNPLSDGVKRAFKHPPTGSCLDGQYAQGSGELTAPETVEKTCRGDASGHGFMVDLAVVG